MTEAELDLLARWEIRSGRGLSMESLSPGDRDTAERLIRRGFLTITLAGRMLSISDAGRGALSMYDR